MASLFPHVPPEQMTPRARAYLFAIAVYCLVIGLACVVLHPDFVSPAFNVIKDRMPFQFKGWASVQMLVGVIAFWASWRGNERFAWYGLIGAAVVSGLWATWFWWPFLVLKHLPPNASFILILLGTTFSLVTAHNLIQARQPLRSPFEPVLRSIEDDD